MCFINFLTSLRVYELTASLMQKGKVRREVLSMECGKEPE
jgi:hypothetical protein